IMENALLCVERGAYDFFSKPIDPDELRVVINRALYLRRLERENQRLQSELVQRDRFSDLIGTSEQMRSVYGLIETMSTCDYTVMISGESGTGKELVARAIRQKSDRSEKPFVVINCGAIPENLLESELFGFEKGAFTHAVAQKIGRFEQADTGIVFLDEIGELPMSLQVKLLRFIEDRRIERIGGTTSFEIDVRILVATHRNLQEEVAQGNFREDLFYRLSVLQIELPPLRDRGEDVLFLARHFLDQFSADNNRRGLRFLTESLKAIAEYSWPGNVRELENKVKRAVILARGKDITPVELGMAPAVPAEGGQPKTLQQVRERAEREHLFRALIADNWNISKVSREMGVSRTTLYELVEKYGLKRDTQATNNSAEETDS
ncbi:MAG: sigma-54 dependent transcriptional regulator, partial [Candidatus Zixiibacteriota bacterium]